jgi:O-antigen/teichoic acid export membrane protein
MSILSKKRSLNSLALMSEKILRIISGIFIGVWIARYLGPENYGIYSYIFAISSIFVGISKLGFDGLLVRELISSTESIKLINTSVFLRLIVSIFIFISALSYYYLTDNKDTYIYLLIVLSGLVFMASDTYEQYIISEEKIIALTIIRISQILFSSALKLTILMYEYDIKLLYFAFLLEYVYLSFILIIHARKNKIIFNISNIDLKIGVELLNKSWPLILSSIVVIIYMRIDQIMIKHMLGVGEVGIYSVGIKITESLYFIPLAIVTSYYPLIAKIYNEDKNLFIKYIRQMYSVMFLIGAIITVILLFISDYIILYLYGYDYSDSVQIMKIHSYTFIFVSIGVLYSKILIIENCVKLSFYRTLGGALINIILNLILINEYGIVGAAYSTLVAQIYVNIVADLFNKKTRNHFIYKVKSIFLYYK